MAFPRLGEGGRGSKYSRDNALGSFRVPAPTPSLLPHPQPPSLSATSRQFIQGWPVPCRPPQLTLHCIGGETEAQKAWQPSSRSHRASGAEQIQGPGCTLGAPLLCSGSDHLTLAVPPPTSASPPQGSWPLAADPGLWWPGDGRRK